MLSLKTIKGCDQTEWLFLIGQRLVACKGSQRCTADLLTPFLHTMTRLSSSMSGIRDRTELDVVGGALRVVIMMHDVAFVCSPRSE